MKRIIAAAIAAFLALSGAGRVAAAVPTMAQVLHATYALHDFGDLGFSPDGTRVAYWESWHPGKDPTATRPVSAVYVRAIDGGAPVRVTAASGDAFAREDEPVWSPNGKLIAFLSNARSKEQAQLFVEDVETSKVRQIGSLKGDVQAIRWSPLGDTVAALYIENAGREAGALAPGARDVGVIGEKPEEQRLVSIDVANGTLRAITPADTYVYEYDWSPDGKRFAVTYAHGNGDNNWWVAKLATVDAASGAMHDVWGPKYQINAPHWSADGKTIAFIGGIMSDFGSVGGDLYTIQADGSTPAVDRTETYPLSVRSIKWSGEKEVTFVADQNGALHLYRYTIGGGEPKALTDAPESIGSWALSRGGGTVAMVRQSFDAPAEIWAGSFGAVKQLTKANAGAPRYYGPAKSLTWKSDGYTVQGWLIAPPSVEPGTKYPLIAVIHGGPSAASLPSFGSRFVAALASQGYYVFQPNPRGSFGEGEAFTAANVKDFGYGDWRDDLAGIDAAVAQAPIDPNRLGLFGWSYGGYMAMWAETQTTRFKGIVAGAGVANWQSYYGQNKIDEWMIPFFGASVYDDPAVYAKSSPITFVKNSKTPILMLQGERDEEVPAPQSFEFWHAMTTLGVPTELRVYADEGHAPQKPADQVDVLTRMVSWFDKYVK